MSTIGQYRFPARIDVAINSSLYDSAYYLRETVDPRHSVRCRLPIVTSGCGLSKNKMRSHFRLTIHAARARVGQFAGGRSRSRVGWAKDVSEQLMLPSSQMLKNSGLGQAEVHSKIPTARTAGEVKVS